MPPRSIASGRWSDWGHTVIPFNAIDFESKNSFVNKAVLRLSAGPGVERLNRELLRVAEVERA